MDPRILQRDIPGVSAQSLSKLDDSGIVYIGAASQGAGDILVGKVTPRGRCSTNTGRKNYCLQCLENPHPRSRKHHYVYPLVWMVRSLTYKYWSDPMLPRMRRIKQIRSVEIENARKDFDDHYRILANETQMQVKELLKDQKLISIKGKQYDGN